MGVSKQFTVVGEKQLRLALMQIGDLKVKRKAAKAILKIAARPLVEGLKQANPPGEGPTGNLRRSYGIIMGKGRHISVYVGPRVAMTMKQKDKQKEGGGATRKGYHAHWLEYGTKERKTKAGKSTGRVLPLNYIARNFNRKSHVSQMKLDTDMTAYVIKQFRTNPNFKFNIRNF